MRISDARTRSLAALSPALLLALLAGGCADTSPPRTDAITGRYIAVLCDADMSATAFADTLLNKKTDATDALTVVPLPIADPDGPDSAKWQTGVTQLHVSNSVIGPPVSIDANADGSRVFVVESRGPAPAGATTMAQLPSGRWLTSVCMEDPANPHILTSIDVGDNPQSVAVHPAGDFVAVACSSPNRQIVMVPVTPEGTFGEALQFPLVGLSDAAAVPSCIAWHPDGKHFAVTIPAKNVVAFFEFRRDAVNGLPGIAPWGEPVTVGKYPGSGKFSPSGNFFVTSDLQWGADVEGFLTGAPEGTLTAIRVSAVPTAIIEPVVETDADGNVTRSEPGRVDNSLVAHEVVSTTMVGISPECMAISPDGRFIVTANVKRSHLPDNDPRLTRGGSLSLVKMNRSSGELSTLGEWPINAMPEGLAFDAAGRHVVVSQFRSFAEGAVDGELSFFKLAETSPAQLIPADFFVGVGIGPHGVVIVK